MSGELRINSKEASTEVEFLHITSLRKTRFETLSANHYALFAISAGLFIGLFAFLYEVIIYTKVDTTTYALYSPIFVGFLSFHLIYHLKEAIDSKIKYGKFWLPEKSAYFICTQEYPPLIDFQDQMILNEPETKVKLNKRNILLMLLRGIVAIASSQMIMLIMYTEQLANLNFSLVSNIFAITPFLVAIAFYFMFKESLNKFYLVGIALIVTSAVITGLSNITDMSEGVQYLSPAIPVILAFFQTILSTIFVITTRYFVKTAHMDVKQMVADTYFLEGLSYLIMYFILGFPYGMSIFFSIVGIGVLGLFSTLFLNIAVAYGKAAPSLALNNCSSLFTLILEITVLHKTPSTLQSVAFFIGLGGALMIAYETKKNDNESANNNLGSIHRKQ